MTPAPKVNHWSLSSLVALATLAGIGGAFVLGVVIWLGGGVASPDARFAKVEQYNLTRKATVDSMFRLTGGRIEDLSGRVDDVADLLGMLVSMQCVSANPQVRNAVRQTQIPCARVLRDRGMSP